MRVIVTESSYEESRIPTKERSTPENVEAILDGMAWLGMKADEGPFFQTERFDQYNEVIHKWLEEGKAYVKSQSDMDVVGIEGPLQGWTEVKSSERQPIERNGRIRLVNVEHLREMSQNRVCGVGLGH